MPRLQKISVMSPRESFWKVSPQYLRRSHPLLLNSRTTLKPRPIETSLKPPPNQHLQSRHQHTFTRPDPISTNRQTAGHLPHSTGRASKPRIRTAAALTLIPVSIGAVALYSTMSSKLVPRHPSEVMVIRNITPNVVTLSVPFSRHGVLKIGGRGTLVRLSSGALAVFSPVALTPEVKQKITELGGTVKYIVAPDMEHHIFVSEWKKEFPEASIIGPEGLPEKRKKMKDEKIGSEDFATVFSAKTKREMTISPEFDADFEYEFIDSHPNKELVFFYKPDKVLIEADLMFNLPAREQYSRVTDHDKDKEGVLGRIFLSIQSTEGDAKTLKRFLWHLISRQNRAGFNESIHRINSWDFTVIIPCHGDSIETGAKDMFKKVFEWHLEDKK